MKVRTDGELVRSQYSCLPSDVKVGDPAVVTAGKRTTVEKALRSLRARCRKGHLVDRHRREIRFFHLVGCWGNPPLDYENILDKQSRELSLLRKRYSVIEIPCDQGQPIQ